MLEIEAVEIVEAASTPEPVSVKVCDHIQENPALPFIGAPILENGVTLPYWGCLSCAARRCFGLLTKQNMSPSEIVSNLQFEAVNTVDAVMELVKQLLIANQHSARVSYHRNQVRKEAARLRKTTSK